MDWYFAIHYCHSESLLITSDNQLTRIVVAKILQMKKRGTIDKLPTNQQQQQQAPLSQGQLGSKVATALAKAEARRQKRLARQAEVLWHTMNAR